MSDQPNMGPEGQRQPTEEEMRAAYEAQLRQVHVDDVLVQTLLSLLNLGAVRAGLTSGGEADRDLGQLRSAIEGIRALLPIVEGSLGADAGPIREALAQLQMTYARSAGAGAPPAGEGGEGGEGEAPAATEPTAPPAGEAPPQAPEDPEGPGPAQRSGRLWVPGQ